MPWYILTLINVFGIAGSRVLQRELLKEKGSDPAAYSAVFQILVAGLFLLIALVVGFDLSGYDQFLPQIILMAFLYAVGGILLSIAYKLVPAANATVYFSTTSVWSIPSSMIILGERPNPVVLLGIAFILSAVVLLNYTRKLSWPKKGELYALAAAVIFSIAFVNDAYIIGDRNLVTYMVIAFLLPGLLTLVLSPRSISFLPKLLQSRLITRVGLMVILYGLGTIALFTAYQSGADTHIIYPISQTSTIAIVLLAALFLKEKDRLLIKSISALLAIVGATIIGLATG
jgi:drug/metabolite transporter (DMT)-like permease